MQSPDPAAKIEDYHNRRAVIRLLFCVFVGLLIVFGRLTDGEVDSGSSAFEITGAIVLIGGFIALFVLDSIWTECPGCTASFKKRLPDYDEGLPLFNNLDRCPWCGLRLTGESE